MSQTVPQTTQVYQVLIKASAQRIWDAITKPEFTSQYFHGAAVDTTGEAPRFATTRPTARRCGGTRRSSSPTRRTGSSSRGAPCTTPRWPPSHAAASPG